MERTPGTSEILV